MPAWAQDDPHAYWQAGDAHERANGRLYSEVQFALPHELDASGRHYVLHTSSETAWLGETPATGWTDQSSRLDCRGFPEKKQATHWTRLSCHRFRANEVRLQLSVIAYNLGNLWRRLVLPTRIERWSLTSLQQRLVKTGGRLVKHARYYWLFLAESHLTRRLFGAMLQRIWALPVPAG